MYRPTRKLRPRLKDHDYFDVNQWYFITIRAHSTLVDRVPYHMPPHQLLTHPPLAIIITNALHYRHSQGIWRLHCYCLMPDHLHFLATPRTKPVADLTGEFESYTTNLAWKLDIYGKLWQRSFHDRLVRADEMAIKVAYILNNPVHAGLVDRWQDWPWSFVRAI
ncbi:MAG: transposase [Ardenticatenales bacterium]|nr:transposase [Ardenticatenales bacterium]